MKSKFDARKRRQAKTRFRIRSQAIPCLLVNKTSQHIYAQIIAPNGASTLAASSSLENDIKDKAKDKSGIEIAKLVGEGIAKKALSLGLKKVAFDRAGFKFHGRIKAIADSAREAGLEF